VYVSLKTESSDDLYFAKSKVDLKLNQGKSELLRYTFVRTLKKTTKVLSHLQLINVQSVRS